MVKIHKSLTYINLSHFITYIDKVLKCCVKSTSNIQCYKTYKVQKSKKQEKNNNVSPSEQSDLKQSQKSSNKSKICDQHYFFNQADLLILLLPHFCEKSTTSYAQNLLTKLQWRQPISFM